MKAFVITLIFANVCLVSSKIMEKQIEQAIDGLLSQNSLSTARQHLRVHNDRDSGQTASFLVHSKPYQQQVASSVIEAVQDESSAKEATEKVEPKLKVLEEVTVPTPKSLPVHQDIEVKKQPENVYLNVQEDIFHIQNLQYPIKAVVEVAKKVQHTKPRRKFISRAPPRPKVHEQLKPEGAWTHPEPNIIIGERNTVTGIPHNIVIGDDNDLHSRTLDLAHLSNDNQ